jgi:hypothetical protein
MTRKPAVLQILLQLLLLVPLTAVQLSVLSQQQVALMLS